MSTGQEVRTDLVVRGFVVQQYAAAVVLFAGMAWMDRLGFGGRFPLPVLAALILVALAFSDERLHRRVAGGDLSRLLWPRILVNLVMATPVLYGCGWGSLLGIIWIVGSLFHITWSGSSAWLPSAVGSGLAILIGELGIASGLFPSYLPSPQTHVIGALQAIIVVMVVAFLGQLVATGERAEATLESEERRFRKMLANSSDMVMVTDAEGRIEWVSPSVRHQFGRDPDELVGTRAERLLGLDDEQLTAWASDPASGDPASVRRRELRCRSADGSVRWHDVVVQNLLDDPDVHGVVINQRDVTEASLVREQLAYQVTHDPLTGLANRSRFTSELADLLQRKDGGTPRCAILYVDLNGFKRINDTYGHAAGDAVLKAVAERLDESVLGSDLPARLGGDEFAVLLTGVDDESGAVAVARRISAAIRSPLLVAGQPLVPSASIGITVSNRDDADASAMLHRGDVAMYRAKRSGEPWVLYRRHLEMS